MVINRKLVRQLVVFGMVGVFATLTHYLVALFFHEILNVNLYVCNLIGYCSAVTVSYFGHGMLTFQVNLNHSVFVRFVVVSVTTFLVSEGILAVMENTLQFSHRISLAVVVLTIPLITFILSKAWVFRHSPI
jgi:putative flippase GtrA